MAEHEPVRPAGADRPPFAPMVDMVMRLGHQLGLEVIAEGVANPTELAAVVAAGCRFGQGALFGWGVPAEHLEAMLEAATSPGARRSLGPGGPGRAAGLGAAGAARAARGLGRARPAGRLGQVRAARGGAGGASGQGTRRRRLTKMWDQLTHRVRWGRPWPHVVEPVSAVRS